MNVNIYLVIAWHEVALASLEAAITANLVGAPNAPPGGVTSAQSCSPIDWLGASLDSHSRNFLMWRLTVMGN